MFDFLQRSRYRGSLDGLSDGLVHGWAQDVGRPREPLSIEIYNGGILVGVARADAFRPDLAAAGIGDGKHAFSFALPAEVGDDGPIAARVAETQYWLSNSNRYGTANSPRPGRGRSISPDWARALTGDREFREEQAVLGHCWTLLGITPDLKKDGDWSRTTLGGRSVFVQRFGDTIRGFENRCAHRFYPLRTSDKGNGPIVCGFHHWHYDRDGHAVGIPNCLELFGTHPRNVGAKLVTLDIATCGSLIFGRFPGGNTSESLEDYLGEGFPILDAICRMPGRPQRLNARIAANWKLSMEITLDDYHNVAIHHRECYAKNSEIAYFRFGLHSAHFTGHADTLASMAAACRENRFIPSGYRIFNIFPNLAISIFDARPYWFCYVQQFAPMSPSQTHHMGWLFQTRLPVKERALDRWTRPVSDLVRARLVRHFVKKIGDEDRQACEQMQTIAHQFEGAPILSAHEKRIEWFEDAYEVATSKDEATSDTRRRDKSKDSTVLTPTGAGP
jgi:phenylpropionate dioxygenase-like ring-hydroxylating dioxygenase large terminal subunit